MLNGNPIAEINLRRPVAKDMVSIEAMKKEGAAGTLAIFALLSGLPEEVLEDLDGYDMRRLSDEFANFFTRAPGSTAAKPSKQSPQ